MKLSFFFSFLVFSASAQFSDTFSDGDFNRQPTWSGDETSFAIITDRLSLKALSTTKSAYLATPSEAINEARWTFTAILDFNPSSNNYTRVYLVADQPNLTAGINGYFVRIGGSEDEISLYKQEGTTTTKIIDGVNGRVNIGAVQVNVRVTRNEAGSWQLSSDIGRTGVFNVEGTANDNTWVASSYFGVLCVYTSTRADKFHFDDFNVTGLPYQDNEPPVALSVEVVSRAEINITFNEALDPNTAQTLTHYTINNGVNKPATAILLPTRTMIKLTFSPLLTNGVYYRLMLSQIADLSGNVMLASSLPFIYFTAVPALAKDIIMTEIQANPTPVVRLPNAEFLEFFNRTDHPFNLAGWRLADSRTEVTLPEEFILPGTYRVVTSADNVSLFGAGASPIGVSSLPTLNNDEDVLTVKTPSGRTIDSVHYTSSWYRNTEKQQGGWSLELIDPNNLCSEEANWTSSEDERGGTPGSPNSVLANKPDLTGPKLVSIVAYSANNLVLTFNERLESPLRSSSLYFIFEPSLNVRKYVFGSNDLRTLSLELSSPLQAQQVYSLTINGIFDCSGNALESPFNTLDFGLPEEAGPGDVLINEILFNPRPNGVDFVEIYNKTASYIDMKGWHITRWDNDGSKNSKLIANAPSILAPKTYRVFTPDPVRLHDHYPQGMRSVFQSLVLPPLPDDEGIVVLTRSDNTSIDSLHYKKEFHSPFLSNDEGVSLERITLSEETNVPSNWRSASSIAGGATPGLSNSNFRPQGQPTGEQVIVEPATFVPYSGTNDFAKISFQFDQPGFVGTVSILDHRGRVIKVIANNEILGQEGFFRWDGDRDDNNKARVGYYYVSFDVFTAEGVVQTFRNRVVVAAP